MKDINSLSHTKWNCKYHIVFAPKYIKEDKMTEQLTLDKIDPFMGSRK